MGLNGKPPAFAVGCNTGQAIGLLRKAHTYNIGTELAPPSVLIHPAHVAQHLGITQGQIAEHLDALHDQLGIASYGVDSVRVELDRANPTSLENIAGMTFEQVMALPHASVVRMVVRGAARGR